eukprot:scaffold4355_cov207-Alexandrium_tamarense.AAC.13
MEREVVWLLFSPKEEKSRNARRPTKTKHFVLAAGFRPLRKWATRLSFYLIRVVQSTRASSYAVSLENGKRRRS